MKQGVSIRSFGKIGGKQSYVTINHILKEIPGIVYYQNQNINLKVE